MLIMLESYYRFVPYNGNWNSVKKETQKHRVHILWDISYIPGVNAELQLRRNNLTDDLQNIPLNSFTFVNYNPGPILLTEIS